jgi:hypothetical protein
MGMAVVASANPSSAAPEPTPWGLVALLCALTAMAGALSFATGAAASSLAGVPHDGTGRPMALVMLVALAGSAVSLRRLALPKTA